MLYIFRPNQLVTAKNATINPLSEMPQIHDISSLRMEFAEFCEFTVTRFSIMILVPRATFTQSLVGRTGPRGPWDEDGLVSVMFSNK